MNRDLNDPTATPSDASLVEVEDLDDLQPDIESNIQEFKRKFKFTELSEEKIVLWATSSRADKKALYASYIKDVSWMHPALYKSILRPGSLGQIIQELRKLRGTRQHIDNGKWERVKARLRVEPEMREYYTSKNEDCLMFWFTRMLEKINIMTNHDQLSVSNGLFGLQGALACPKPGSKTTINPEAGYLSRADMVFFRGTDPFAVVEFKMDRAPSANKPWYEYDAVLAQIFCGLSGSKNCRFGLVLTQTGYKLIYRVESRRSRHNDPIYDYFMYPPGEQDSPLAMCQGTTGLQVFEDLLMIMRELTLTSTKNPAVGGANKIARTSENSYNANTMSGAQAEVDLLTRKLEDLKLKREVFTSYKFEATTVDGSTIPLEGMSDFSQEFIDANYESSSESEYE